MRGSIAGETTTIAALDRRPPQAPESSGNDRAEEIVDVVDEDDEVTGQAQMREVRARNLLRRGVQGV